MESIFADCVRQLDEHRYRDLLPLLPELVRRAQSAEECVVAARVAGLALFTGLERRLLRQAAQDQSCRPGAVRRLAGHYLAHGSFLLLDELLTPYLESEEWPAIERAQAHGLMAVAMAARHRYNTAETHLDRTTRLVAEAREDEPADLRYDRLAVPYFAGRWEEVSQGLRELIDRGDATPSVYQLLARCCEHLGRPEEALEALQAGSLRFPEHPLLWSIQGGLCWSLNQPDEALSALGRFGALLPYRRHQRHVERLRSILAREVKRLAVPVVRQGRNHCFPACLAMVRSYWGQTDDQRAIGAAVMDGGRGTPLYRALQYLEEQGWTCRAFRATVDRTKALIDRGVPPILGLEYSGGAHVHVCVGYDEEHQELILQDPAHPYPSRLRYQDFAELYAQSDYWAMAFAPASQAEALAGLPSEDDRMIRQAQRLWEALRADELTTAAQALVDLEKMDETPGLHLTRLRAWPRLVTREAAMASVDALLTAFPDHVQIRAEVAQHLARLGELARAADVVRAMVGSRPAQAWLILADEAARSGRAPAEVIRFCRRAVMADPLSPHPLAEWGREEQRAGNWAGAEQLFAAAYEMDPQPAFAADLAALKADQGQPHEALKGLREVLRESRRYPWAWWRRGEIHWALGEMRRSIRCLRIAVEQAPEDPHYVLRLSQALDEMGQAERAAALLRQSPHLGRSADLQNSLAVLALNQGWNEEAHTQACAAMEQFPADGRFAPIAAEALLRMGRGPEGRTMLEAAAERLSDSAYLTGRLGHFLLQAGDTEAGLDAIRKALQMAPGWTVPIQWTMDAAEEGAGGRALLEFLESVSGSEEDQRWRIARAWLNVDPERAMALAGQALDGSAEALTEYGRIAVDANRAPEAHQAFQEALRLEPNQARACYGMALLVERDQDPEAYSSWMRRAIQAAADPEMARRYADRLGDVLEHRGEWAELERLLVEIEGRVPEGWRITYVGYARERQGRLADALALYDRAQQLDRSLAWPHYRRVVALLEQEQYEAALAAATAASARFPRDVSVAWVRGRVHHAMGQTGAATEAYRVALALEPDWPPARRSLFELWSDQGWQMLADQARHLPARPRADLQTEWGEVYLEHGRLPEAQRMFELALQDNPDQPGALSHVALEHAQRRQWPRVFELLHRSMEGRTVPGSFPSLVDLYLQAALILDKPRRPHWRELALARLRYLRSQGAALAPEAHSLRRAFTQLELEFGNLRSATYALAIRDILWNGIAVFMQWIALRLRLRRTPLDIRPGESAGPLLHRPLTVIHYQASGGSPLYRWGVRVLSPLAAWAYASPGTAAVLLLLAVVYEMGAGNDMPWTLLVAGAPLGLLITLDRLPGVERVEEET
ncbi:MAG: tetratricopeptide repeat protein [Bacillota bacterium]